MYFINKYLQSYNLKQYIVLILIMYFINVARTEMSDNRSAVLILIMYFINVSSFAVFVISNRFNFNNVFYKQNR